MFKLGRYLLDIVPVFIKSFKLSLHGDFIISVKLTDLSKLLMFLSYHTFCVFAGLMDYFCSDFLFLSNDRRFLITLYLLSFSLNQRLSLSYVVPFSCQALSVSLLYKSACWLEREIWDLFGVFFVGNSDLRRILTDYGFSGFPLRKDFPVTGFFELRYNDMLKRIVVLNVSLVQEFRNFDYVNPWLAV